MSNWVEVNGARIEKEFFDANLSESKSYDWTEAKLLDFAQHSHCMICGATICSQSSMTTRAYKSKTAHVCAYCYDHFLKSLGDPQARANNSLQRMNPRANQ